ncbi:MAG: hypothetical protein MUE51_00455 [Thermoleophilia bacterium]|jgi:hypothetical protein|nr:hypothetical protein [Thermoleophilia bacterium]
MSADAAWDTLVDELEPWVTVEWTRYAREHGSQPWVRLVILVDAHHLLAQPRVAEKVAQAMSDLADGREPETAGWEEIRRRSRDQRHEVVDRLVAAGPGVLPEDLGQYFLRSINPLAVK